MWMQGAQTRSKHGLQTHEDYHVLFNQALLARQAWRLLTKPDSLCARFLRATYYPKEKLLDTVFKNYASPVWRGIEYGLDLLKQGIIRRIGDDMTMRISRDNWLPRKIGLKITSKRKSSKLIKLKSLIGEDQKWNQDLVEITFLPHDADHILDIKIPAHAWKDMLACN
jgi:hypothetical protein